MSKLSEVKILVRGYAKPTGGSSYKASPTSTLIKDSGKLVLVDPGANKEKLLKALEKEKLSPKDIDIVFLTHYHPDHVLNIRLFPDKDIYDGSTIYSDDNEKEFSETIPGTKIKIISTPGHASEHVSLIVKTREGIVCVAGDLWWWMDTVKQKTDTKSLLSLKDPFVKDERALLNSRKRILKIADIIIPGHGKMFLNPVD
jgi:glyoxylase-like metal-dependent hydrolase (beta-lactamase superfamily II)